MRLVEKKIAMVPILSAPTKRLEHFAMWLNQTGVVKGAKLNFGRRATALVAAVAWFSISNHCTLAAAAAARADSTTSVMHCHSNQPAPNKQKNEEAMPCCKVLKALEAKTATVVPTTFDFVLKEYLDGAILPIISEPHGLLIACNSGPPAHAFSFSESVLQRSILAHAPPVSLS